MQTLSFVPINLHRCWPREWKHSKPDKSHADNKTIPDRACVHPLERFLKQGETPGRADLESGSFNIG